MARGDIYVEQYIQQHPLKVWQALTTSELLGSWWAAGDVQPVVGHRFTLDMGPWGRQDCQVVNVQAPFLFSCRCAIGALNTTLTWGVGLCYGGTRLTLRHEGFDLDAPAGRAAFQGMVKGWLSLLPQAAAKLGGPMPGESGQCIETEFLDSGKSVSRTYKGEGWLWWERHDQGALGFSRYYTPAGELGHEAYFFRHKHLSKKKYEALCQDFPDMPAPGGGMDIVDELKQLQQQKLKKWRADFAAHKPRPEQATTQDGRMLGYTQAEDAVLLDDSVDPGLRVCFDEKRPKTVKTIREQLGKLGFTRAWLIDVDMEDMGRGRVEADARGVVLELPADPALRKKAFEKIAKDFVAMEFDPPMDDGQRFEFVGNV